MTEINYDGLVERLRELDTHLEGEFWTIGNAATAIQTLRTELTDTKARLAEAVEAVKILMEMSEPPERNCSCHISPPCGWCIEYAGITEAYEYAASFLAKQEPSQ